MGQSDQCFRAVCPWFLELKSNYGSDTLSGIPDNAFALGRAVDSVNE